MDYREKVIKGLKMHKTGLCNVLTASGKEYCPYWENNDNCMLELLNDALSLLKAQEPIKPKVNIDTWVCGNCGTRIERQSLIGPNAVLAETFNFCPECGKAVKWDEPPKEET